MKIVQEKEKSVMTFKKKKSQTKIIFQIKGTTPMSFIEMNSMMRTTHTKNKQLIKKQTN